MGLVEQRERTVGAVVRRSKLCFKGPGSRASTSVPAPTVLPWVQLMTGTRTSVLVRTLHGG